MAVPFRVAGIPILSGLPTKSLFQEPIYVSSVTGSADNSGVNPRYPAASLAEVFSSDKVGVNGVIVVGPGHSETVTAAAGILMDIAGVHIMGLGEGTARPTINFTTVVGADIDVTAANITIENFYFDATGIDDLAGAIDVDAAYFTMRNCGALLADAGAQCDDFIVADTTADNMLIEDCLFAATTDAGPQSAIQLIGCDHPVIKNNVFYGDFLVGPIENVSTACTRVLIEHNDMDNYNASDICITLVTTTDGTIRYNTLNILTNAEVTWITAATDVQLYENYGVNNDAEAGGLIGVVST